MPNGTPPSPQQPAPPDEEQFDIQNQDHWDNAPEEYKDHLMKAFLHAAGMGAHPGKYKGRKPEPPSQDTITEADTQRAHEAGYDKMRAAQTGQELGPSQFQQQQVAQLGQLQRQANVQQAAQATQAQAGMKPPNAPPAPSGPAGVTTPFPAQQAPGAVPTTGKSPSPPQEEESQ